jgi:DNA-binding SARP family transcriptional activator/Tfp pilus assembly protein PilF
MLLCLQRGRAAPAQRASRWDEVLSVEFGLLGPLLIRDGERSVPVSAPRQRVLLAALLLNAGRMVSVDALAEILWEGQPPAGARGALHSAVQRLRVTLSRSGTDLIETHTPGYLIRVDSELDVRRFGRLAARGHAAAEAGAWAEAAGLLREALGLWRGEPLADVPSRLLHSREVPALEDQRLQVLAARIDADLHLGRHGEIVAELRQVVTAHPLQEQFHAQLMLSLYRSGRSADALAAYQEVRRALADELGIDPGPELRLLHQRILAADGELLLPAEAGPADPGPPVTVARPPVAGQDAVPSRPQTHPPVVPRQLPAATRHFAGRTEELTTLARLAGEVAETSHTPVIALIEGTAGIGKTTLALRFAHQVAGQFPDGQLYVNLRGFDPAGPPMPPAEAIRLFLEALAAPATRIPADLAGQGALYRSVLAGKRMLVLLDNARDVDQVRPLIPASPGCMVIVTSRSELTSLVAIEGALPLTLDVLSGAEARELLTRHLGAQRVEGDRQAADELIEMCARLPLALSIAAARTASRSQVPLSALTTDLRDARRRLDALDAGHAAANVRAVLSWSYQQLDAAAARLFRLLGLRAGPDISAAAAASLAGLPLAEGRRRLAELTRAHLLAETAAGRFASHDLLRAYAADLTQSADSAAERRAATGRLLDHYLHTAHSAALKLHPVRRPVTLAPPLPGAAPEEIADAGQALSWFEAEGGVLMAATARAFDDGFDTHAWQIPWTLSRFLEMRGRWQDWACVGQIALAAAQRLGDQVVQAAAHQRLGYAIARLGRYDDAHYHLQLALSIYTERDDQAGQAQAQASVAITLSYQGRHHEALGHAQHALTSYTAAGDLPGQALALNTIGWFHAVLGDYPQALSACGRALDLFRELGSQEDMALTLDSLGYAHQQAGHFAEATACYQQALDLHREIGSRWGVAETLGHLGDVRQAAGNPEAARAAWEEALTILADLHHPDMVRVRDKLKDLGTAPTA